MDIVRIYEIFPSEDDCIQHLERVRWHGKPICPYCKSLNVTSMPTQERHHCNNCNTSLSVTVGTIFHHTHLPLQKWFLAACLILNAKRGVSARQLGRDLHVNKDTAWRIAIKVRDAMTQREQREILTGIVECDETYIGGKPRPGSGPNKRGRGTKRSPVVGMVERNDKIKAEVVKTENWTAKVSKH
jgi:transposase-like protein